MSLVIAVAVALPNVNFVALLLAGTPDGDQFPAVFQLPLTAPNHV
jgi:hypothetical protein